METNPILESNPIDVQASEWNHKKANRRGK
jgi:hypothetical protein